MSNLIPGNQKHLTLDNRVAIEKILDLDMALKEIAKPLCKDPSTISKEIKKHRTFHPHNDLGIRGPVNRCINKKDCSLHKVYPNTSLCKGRCASCKKISCNKVCKDFVPDTCKRLLRAPFVCNGCPSIFNHLSAFQVERHTYRIIGTIHYPQPLPPSPTTLSVSYTTDIHVSKQTAF